MRITLILLVLFSANVVSGQTSPRERPLPPSLQQELQLRKGRAPRIVRFTDTVKAQTLIARSIRDSSAQELDSTKVGDSAVVVIDASVSLSRKELLDSMLAELPEYEITPSGGRFKYPPEILVETSRSTVAFDTTIYASIEPVSREILPYFDALPLPMPIAPREVKHFVIDAGVGAPSAPSVGVEWRLPSSDKTSATLYGNYINRVGDVGAVRSHFHFGLEANTLFSGDFNDHRTLLPLFSGDIQAKSTNRLLITQNDSAAHSATHADANLAFSLGETKQLRLESKAHINFFYDEAFGGTSEQSAVLVLSLLKDISTSSRFQFDALYHAAGSINDSISSLSLLNVEAVYHHFDIAPFEWSIGVNISGVSAPSDATTYLQPVARIIFHPNTELSFGASFEPRGELTTVSALSERNLFYAFASAKMTGRSLDKRLTNDPRSVAVDNINISAFGNYFLTLDNYIHGELRFITRKNEIVFDKLTDSITKRTVFFAHPARTRRVVGELGAKLFFFQNDECNASLRYTSATAVAENSALLYEPIFRAEASWTFRSLSKMLSPRIEFVSLSRKDRSLVFINAELHYQLTANAAMKLRTENIFGGAGDYWDGYNEYPRSILVSIRAAF